MTAEQSRAVARLRRGVKLAEEAVPHIGEAAFNVPEIQRLLALLCELQSLHQRRAEMERTLAKTLKDMGIDVRGLWPQEIGAAIRRLCGE